MTAEEVVEVGRSHSMAERLGKAAGDSGLHIDLVVGNLARLVTEAVDMLGRVSSS
jgi:hypothetical protein